MEHIDWQNRPEPSICPHSIQSYGFNRFLERIRSWSPSNSALRCQECEKEEMVKSSRKTKKATFSFRAKFLWVCLECDRILCGAENLGRPDSHIRSHAIKNNHLFAIPIAAWCLTCKSIQRITTMETNKELEINKELDSASKIKKGLGGVQQGDFDNLPCDYVVIPLQNLGNICFFNAILQNLLSMRVLRANFRKLDCQPQSVSHDLRILFLDTDDILVDDVDHTDLFDSIYGREPSFLGHHEHDSHELLRRLFSLVLAEGTSFIQDIFGGKLSSTVSCVQCGNASKSYERFLDLSLAIPSNECSTKNDEVSAPRDPVPSSMEISSYPSRDNSSLQETHIVPPDTENVDLSSQFSDVNPNVSSRKRLRLEGQAQSGNNNGDPLSIEKCLDLFIAPEILCGEYVCDRCSNRSQDHLETELQSTSKNENFKEGEGLGGHEDMDEVKPAVESKEGVAVGSRKAEMKASKRYLIFKAPLVLTIHLKRLTRDTDGIIKKINSHVNIQELLDLTPYMDPSCEDKEKLHYRLIGMVEHVGVSLRGGQSKGHYVAYVRGVRRKRHKLAWFRVSDDVVQEVSLNKVLDSEAYILFYERMRS